ncbi:MAG TPA: glycosyltransferase family A protein [Conexibacter sp.]|jgi:biofilm PGA synthesis N-glycosyltransferase PgaC|nr:glycosyltransferase family A protein [Conexibacter sp.]
MTRMVIIVPFFNEERFLPSFLASVERQTRRPDQLMLVDDGSTDGSPAIAATFAARHDWASVLTRPPKPLASDRLALAPELVAFAWARDQLSRPADAIGKFDGDLELSPATLATLEQQLEHDPRLGIVGAYLSIRTPPGDLVREDCPPQHVRGATKLYRTTCLEQISPLPATLGWDTIDASHARMRGWRTQTVAIPGGDPIHLRPTGAYDGRLRAFRRWGACAYAFGAHPLWVALGAARRLGKRPYVVCGLSYALGWTLAALRRRPRADAAIRRHVRREQMQWLRQRIGRQPASP